MTQHDHRCDVSDQQVLDDVAEHGWHVMNVLDLPDSPGWAYSIGLYQNFDHPEVVVFGLNAELMHSIINSVGNDIRAGKRFMDGRQYPELIDAYSCIFKTVDVTWYYPFLGYANWFYKGTDYPCSNASGRTRNLFILGTRISTRIGCMLNLCYFTRTRRARSRLIFLYGKQDFEQRSLPHLRTD